MTLHVKLIHQDALIPTRSTSEAAGFDLYAIEDSEIHPHKLQRFPTGVCLEIPKGLCGKIFDRSSLAMQQITVLGGIIDSDFRGELIVVLHNLSDKPYVVKKYNRIAQLILFPHAEFQIRRLHELSPTDRGTKAFGSSGK